MKKIINNPTDVVSEALMGMQAAYPDKLVYTPKMEVISRKEKKTDKVAVISGGGAGHEPLHAGFVGKVCWMQQFPEMYSLLRARTVSAVPLSRFPAEKAY